MSKSNPSSPLCYKCKYRKPVTGSSHSKCEHPLVKEALNKLSYGLSIDENVIELLSIFSSIGRVSPILIIPKKMGIEFDKRGYKNGWFNFPFDYDPIWLKKCEGFEEKGGEINDRI